MSVVCGDCGRDIPDHLSMTEINPPGGYGRPQFLVCDDCMKSNRWDEWKAEHWPNWPSKLHKVSPEIRAQSKP